MITIVLADDDGLGREALRCLLERERDFRVVGDAGGTRDAVRMVVRRKPRVLIVRAAVPGPDGLELTRQVRAQAPSTQVIVLSRLASEWHLLAALRSGAVGYVTSGARQGNLLQAIRRAAAGAHYLSAPFSESAETWIRRAEAADAADPLEALTARERQILRLVAEGHSSTQIAHRLSISPRTAESHRASVMRKLRLSNYVQLIRFALLRGILPIMETPVRR